MMTGRNEEEHSILHLPESMWACSVHSMSSNIYLPFYSHLNSLVPVFNKVAREHFIDNLRSRADGETVVDMLTEFGNATLQMISMVYATVIESVAIKLTCYPITRIGGFWNRLFSRQVRPVTGW